MMTPLGAMRMAEKGLQQCWGLGRHVLGSNHFHYVQRPWRSFSDSSADIDHSPADCDWNAGDCALENLVDRWGPESPKDFIVNHAAMI